MTLTIILLAVVAILGLCVGFVFGKSVTKRRKIKEGLDLSRSEIENLFEQERKQIANGLHDDTVQRMVAVRFRLEQVLYSNSPERIGNEIDSLRNEIEDIISALRFLIKGLIQPRFHRTTFSVLIRSLVESLNAIHHLTVVLEVEDEDQEFDLLPDVKQNLYYIIHEVCHNFLKSSMGFKLLIRMRWSNELNIHIEDNGQGITGARGYGYGMETIQMRAKQIGALVSLPSAIGRFEMAIYLKKR